MLFESLYDGEEPATIKLVKNFLGPCLIEQSDGVAARLEGNVMTRNGMVSFGGWNQEKKRALLARIQHSSRAIVDAGGRVAK